MLCFNSYQMKLTSIENLRKDGKFYDDRGHIPEGKYISIDLWVFTRHVGFSCVILFRSSSMCRCLGGMLSFVGVLA